MIQIHVYINGDFNNIELKSDNDQFSSFEPTILVKPIRGESTSVSGCNFL